MECCTPMADVELQARVTAQASRFRAAIEACDRSG